VGGPLMYEVHLYPIGLHCAVVEAVQVLLLQAKATCCLPTVGTLQGISTGCMCHSPLAGKTFKRQGDALWGQRHC
jgi:hypothetical protein